MLDFVVMAREAAGDKWLPRALMQMARTDRNDVFV